MIILGKYRHYKGGEYQVMTEGKLEANGEAVVVYKSLEQEQVWVRPLAEFIEEVEQDGRKVSRFEYVKE